MLHGHHHRSQLLCILLRLLEESGVKSASATTFDVKQPWILRLWLQLRDIIRRSTFFISSSRFCSSCPSVRQRLNSASSLSTDSLYWFHWARSCSKRRWYWTSYSQTVSVGQQKSRHDGNNGNRDSGFQWVDFFVLGSKIVLQSKRVQLGLLQVFLRYFSFFKRLWTSPFIPLLTLQNNRVLHGQQSQLPRFCCHFW